MTCVSNKPPGRPRSREPGEDRERATAGIVPWEQGRLFAQLFASEGDGAGYGASLSGMKASADVAMIEALADQLAPRVLAGAQWPLQAVLYLPRLGRINASVRREQGAWGIDLDAEHDATARWLREVRQDCQGRLTRSLGMPVSLQLPTVGLT